MEWCGGGPVGSPGTQRQAGGRTNVSRLLPHPFPLPPWPLPACVRCGRGQSQPRRAVPLPAWGVAYGCLNAAALCPRNAVSQDSCESAEQVVKSRRRNPCYAALRRLRGGWMVGIRAGPTVEERGLEGWRLGRGELRGYGCWAAVASGPNLRSGAALVVVRLGEGTFLELPAAGLTNLTVRECPE